MPVEPLSSTINLVPLSLIFGRESAALIMLSTIISPINKLPKTIIVPNEKRETEKKIDFRVYVKIASIP